MKRNLLTLLAFTLFGQVSIAQQIPNGDMENWTISGALSPDGEYPTDWSTVNNTVPDAQAWLLSETCFEETTDVHGGSSACRLETVAPPLAGFPNVNGITTNGTVNETTYAIEGGIPYTFRPDSLVGWFKATPVGTDFATIEIVLKDAAEDTIGWARFEAPNSTVSAYTRFSAPVVYQNANTPTQAAVLLSASDGFNSVVGSQLWVDDLELIFNPVGIEEVDFDQVSAYASNGRIFMQNALPNQVVAYDIISLSGQVINSGRIDANSKGIVSENLANGMYFVRFMSGGQQKTVKLYFAK